MAMPAFMAILDLQQRQDDSSPKSQYNSGHWINAHQAEADGHATERTNALVQIC